MACQLVEAHATLFCTNDIQWREPGRGGSVKIMFRLGLPLDVCEPMCFKLDEMLDKPKVYRLFPPCVQTDLHKSKNLDSHEASVIGLPKTRARHVYSSAN